MDAMPDNREDKAPLGTADKPAEQIRWRPGTEDIPEILNAHRAWLESGGKNGTRAELFFADLDDFDLHKANLKQACLWETTLHRADLSDVDLTETEGVLAKNLAGANLKGAKLDEDIEKFSGLKTVESASRHARKVFFITAIVMVYTWLTLASVTDATLLLQFDALKLPFAGITIPATAFFGAMPIILLCLFIYFQLLQQRVWEAMADLPAVFPDGTPLNKKVYPWLLNGIAGAHVTFIRKNRPVFSRFQNAISIIVAWWLIPYTMLWFWVRYLSKRDWMISGIHIGAVSLAIGFSFFFIFLARRTLRGQSLRGHGPVIRTLLFLILAGFFSVASYGIIEYNPDTTEKQPLAFVMTIAEKLGFNTNVNFSNIDVSMKPSGWTVEESQISEVRGAPLAGMKLPNAQAVNAFLVKADLQGADLSYSLLDSADLRYANLSSADFSGSSMVSANLQYAIMAGTVLDGADIRDADFSRVTGLTPRTLYSATNWLQAKFGGDILDSLGLPADHNDRIARRDLSGADLSGANFRDISLAGFNLSGTNLQNADLEAVILDSANLFLTDLRKARGLNLKQIRKSRNWLFAMYDDELIQTLGLPQSHNELASQRDFRTYDLKGVNLSEVDLKGANLRKVDLTGAVLEGVNLQDADLYAVKLNNADLSNANFKGTILLDTDLRGAKLTGVKGLTIDQLRWAIIDSSTVVPEYLNIPELEKLINKQL